MKSLYIFLATIFATATSLIGNIPPNDGFERFPNYYFVETGTFGGDGIQLALRAQYPEIHSIELDAKLYRNGLNQFRSLKNVHIWQGNSGLMLYDVIKDLDKPITFWLDGHNGVYDPNGNNTPILEELGQIKKHHIKTHTILIDDMHCCNSDLFDYITKDDIIKKIKEINPDYVITYVDGGSDGEYPNNIMVAYVPTNKDERQIVTPRDTAYGSYPTQVNVAHTAISSSPDSNMTERECKSADYQ